MLKNKFWENFAIFVILFSLGFCVGLQTGETNTLEKIKNQYNTSEYIEIGGTVN